MKIFFLLFILTFTLYSQNMDESLGKGIGLFNEKKFQDSILYLEKVREEMKDKDWDKNKKEDVYFYLGIAYENLKLYDHSVVTYLEGIDLKGEKEYLFHFNMGNSYARENKYQEAINEYNNALNLKNDFASAYLNRSNALIKVNRYLQAVYDYKKYLEFEPDSLQKDQIQKMQDMIYRQQEIIDKNQELNNVNRETDLDDISLLFAQRIKNSLSLKDPTKYGIRTSFTHLDNEVDNEGINLVALNDKKKI